YRLNVFPIHVPPLRERKEDIPLLVAFFMQRFGRRFGKPIEAVRDAALQQMRSYDWPGNLRELQFVIVRTVILSAVNVLELEPLLISSGKQSSSQPADQILESKLSENSVATSLDEIQKRHIESVLQQAGWVVEGPNGAAKRLNLHPNTLRSRM